MLQIPFFLFLSFFSFISSPKKGLDGQLGGVLPAMKSDSALVLHTDESDSSVACPQMSPTQRCSEHRRVTLGGVLHKEEPDSALSCM